MIQLQEIRLYDINGLLDLEDATALNPDGSNPNAHPISNIIDADVTSCYCLYQNSFQGTIDIDELIFCAACTEYTKGNKWLDFNTQEPCVDDAASDCDTTDA